MIAQNKADKKQKEQDARDKVIADAKIAHEEKVADAKMVADARAEA
jgi:hypothetical protein